MCVYMQPCFSPEVPDSSGSDSHPTVHPGEGEDQTSPGCDWCSVGRGGWRHKVCVSAVICKCLILLTVSSDPGGNRCLCVLFLRSYGGRHSSDGWDLLMSLMFVETCFPCLFTLSNSQQPDDHQTFPERERALGFSSQPSWERFVDTPGDPSWTATDQ